MNNALKLLKIKYLHIFLISLFLTFTSPCFAQENTLSISGYYKNLLTSSKSSYTDEDIYAVTQRLRLELKKQLDPWQFYLTLDNEAIINDFGNTLDFDPIRSNTQEKISNIDLDKVSVDNEHLYLKHSVYRAFLKYYDPKFQVVIGKQAIDWGKMRFYSPLDLFNSVGSTDIEQNEKTGVDAINLNFSPTSFSGLNLVISPGNDEKTMIGVKAYEKLGTYDCSFISSVINKDLIFGVAFDGYIKNAGLRGELTFNRLDNKRSFPRLSIGTDYNPTDKLYLLFEQFYNGGADDNDPSAFLSYKKARQIMTAKKHLSGLNINYQITPLCSFDNYSIYDWEGKSVVVDNEIRYNISQNADITAGVQLFFGDNNSEFGSYKNLFFTEFKLFF